MEEGGCGAEGQQITGAPSELDQVVLPSGRQKNMPQSEVHI